MTLTLMTLTKDNYHSIETDRLFMSHSQYQDFLRCEAMAMAKLQGWQEPVSDAMLVGSYVHAYFESLTAFREFRENHPEIFSSRGPNKGELKNQFKIADAMITTVENDELCMFVLQGQKEVVLTAELFGALWKVKLDVYNPESKRIVDIKTVDCIRKKVWDHKYGYVSFVEANRYHTQMAVYAEIERRHAGRDGWLETLIVAVSKEDPPDKEIISIGSYDIQRELEEIEKNMPRILSVKAGFEEPIRCEKCRYCRETKKLDRIVHFTDLLAG